MDFYNASVTTLFRAPEYAGTLHGDSVITGRAGVKGQSDLVQIQLQLESQVIVNAAFKVQGKMTTVAAAEFLCRSLIGKSINEASSISPQSIKNGLDLPDIRFSSAVLAHSALENAINNLNNSDK